MASQGRSADNYYIPFNFSSVLPFDSLAAALAELPSPQVREPYTQDSKFLDNELHNVPPDESMEESMLQLLCRTAQEGAWSHIADSAKQRFPAQASLSHGPDAPSGVNSLSEKLLTRLERSRRPPSIPLSFPQRTTPKRPRRAHAVVSVSTDFGDSESTKSIETKTRPAVHDPLAADHPPATVSMRRTPAVDADTHSRDLRVQQVSRAVDRDDLNCFVNFLNHFVTKADALAANGTIRSEANLQVTRNVSYMIELRENVILHAGQGAIPHISPSLLASVVSILESRISESLRQCDVKSATPENTSSALLGVRLGLLASSIVLAIMCAPETPRVLLVEEVLENIANLLREVSTILIYPSYDPLYRSSRSKGGQKPANKGKLRNSLSSKANRGDGDVIDEGRSPVLGRVGKSLFDSCCSLYDALMTLFLKEHHLPDSFVTRCASTCIESFSVTGIARLQMHSMRTLCAIFLNYTVHRVWILDNVVRDVAANVPSNRRHLRCFQLPGERTEIRVSSALIAELLCLASSDKEESSDSERKGDGKESDEHAWSVLWRNRHDRAAKMAAHVWEFFLKRSFSERESESRVAFQALLEDILVLYGRPEWPSAELMLQTISVSLISKMRTQEERSAYSRAFSIDVLGALAKRMCDLYGDEVVQDAPSMDLLQSKCVTLEREREKLLVFLDPNKSLLFKAANSFYEALFVTDDHGLAICLRDKSKDLSSKDEDQSDTDNDEDFGEDVAAPGNAEIPLDTEAAALSRARNVERRRAQKEHIDEKQALSAARYVGVNRCFARGFRTILDAILDGMQDTAPTVRAKSIKALSLVDEACHGILRVLPNVLLCIEASCRDVSTLARDAALDLLSRSVAPIFAPSENDRISGNAAQFLQSAEDRKMFQRVFCIVEKRLWDTSTSVRKRAVSIMRSVMSDALKRCKELSQGQAIPVESSKETKFYEDRVIQICTSLVARLDDSESSVREAAERTLRLGLFGFDSSGQARLGQAQDSQSVALLSQRLTAVFMRLPSNSHQSFLSRIFHDNVLSDQKPFLAAIVNACVDRLHDYEATLAGTSGGKSLTELSPSEVKEVKLVSAKRVASCSVLRAFSGLDPALLTSHCRALAPSIKGVLEGAISEIDLACVQRILNVLELGVGTTGEWDIEFLEELMHDIELLVCQSPVQVLEEAAVRCLCVVTKKAATPKGTELLLRAASNFMEFLHAEKDSMKQYCRGPVTGKPSALERNARGALVRLGLLVRYGDFEEAFISEVYATLESICGMLCVASGTDVLARASVRALSHVLIRHRHLLTKGTRVLLSAMQSSNFSKPHSVNSFELKNKRECQIQTATMFTGVQLCVWQGFHELLRDEEERNSAVKKEALHLNGYSSPKGLKGQKRLDAKTTKVTTHEVPNSEHNAQGDNVSQPVLAAEEDAEAGYLALSAQAMMPQLEEAVHSSATAVRRTVANILGLLVRQGLVLPATVIPSLFCLLLDQDPRCREYSYRVVSFLADRHSDMLASASLPGLRRCFQSSFFVRYSFLPVVSDHMHPTESAVTVEKILAMSVDDSTGQSLLSQAIMSMRRDQRRGVLESLIREFDPRVALCNGSPDGDTSGIHAQERAMNGIRQAEEARLASSDSVTQDDDDDEDDDDIVVSTCAELDIVTADRLCSLPALYFFAVTLATLDYTDGAGLGGSLTQGGGTAAADTKLKYAREDVSYLVGIATRIISNSGQATLQVAQQLLKRNRRDRHHTSSEKKRKTSLCASRISLLLLLKNHLKLTRWKQTLDAGESEVLATTSCRMPSFCPGDAALQLWMNQSGRVDAKSNEQMNDSLTLFIDLMREDAIDESEVAAPIRTSRSGRGTGKRNTIAHRSGKRIRRRQGAEANSDSRKERPSRQAAQNAAKKLRFDEESD